MRNLLMVLPAAVLVGGSLGAQERPAPLRRELQQQVVERFMQNARVQAGLTDNLFERYRRIALRFIADNNEIQTRERDLWLALEGQMRPGVAADEDSVTALIDSLVAIPQRRMELARANQRQYAEFLTPVQRAQLMLLHRRFENNIRQIMQRRLVDRPGPGVGVP